MKISGKCSFFGGSSDKGMDYAEGLALYEHKEADLRPDLFYPQATDPNEGTSQRLKVQSLYIALRFNKEIDRHIHQHSMWKVTNPKTGQWVVASLVDYGPHQSTGRIVDLSPAIGQLLRVETDQDVEVEKL